MKRLEEIRDFAFKAHADTNHMYGGVYPYSYHLQMVADVAERYIHLFGENAWYTKDMVLATAYLHDSIEDARLTYNDVKDATESHEVAEAVFYLTNNRGRTRAERADDNYYEGIRGNVIASYIKLCDRIANLEHGNANGSGMSKKYAKEMDNFLEKTDADKNYPEMAEYLRSLC